jgi:hypothetical protein
MLLPSRLLIRVLLKVREASNSSKLQLRTCFVLVIVNVQSIGKSLFEVLSGRIKGLVSHV